MLTQDELDRLIDVMSKTGVTFLDIEGEETKLRLAIAPSPVATPDPNPPAMQRQTARSPGIGSFAPRAKDDGLPPLPDGAAVKEGEVLGYVARGAVRLPIVAPASGQLSGDLPDVGTLFGHGDPVFYLETPA